MAYKIKIPKLKEKKEKWKKVGVVGVDSGTLHIGDPAYSEELNYEKDVIKGMENKQIHQLKFKLGHKGRGVITETGLGDGVYPVYAKVGKVDRRGKRVKEIKIKFIEK